MTQGTNQVAASQQRARIPTEWLVELQTWSDDALLSLSRDVVVAPSIRAYAGWELDYRIAFAVEVHDPDPPTHGHRGLYDRVMHGELTMDEAWLEWKAAPAHPQEPT